MTFDNNTLLKTSSQNESQSIPANLNLLWTVLFGSLCSFLLTLISVTIVSWNYPEYIPPSTEILNQLLPDCRKFAIGWEKDRFIYLYSLVTYPILLLFFTYLFKVIIYSKLNFKINLMVNVILVIFNLFLAIFWLTNYQVHFLYFLPLFNNISDPVFLVIYIFLAILVVTSIHKYEVAGNCINWLVLHLSQKWYWKFVIVLTLLQIPERIMSYEQLLRFQHTIHTCVVQYSILNVYYGFPLLWEYQHQYGLYPMLLSPLLKVFHLKPILPNIILLMTLISVFVTFITCMGIRKFYQSSHVLIITVLFLTCAYLPHNFTGDYDPYFQYHPVRTLFPAILIYLLSDLRYLQKQHLNYLATIILSFGVLWNTDSGVVTYFAWLLINVYYILYHHSNNVLHTSLKIATKLVLQIVFLFISLMSYYLYVLFIYGKEISYTKTLAYQKIFYLTGFFMIPTPLIHPWWCIALAVVIGLACSLYYLYSKADQRKGVQLFGLSILYSGLFSYYNGRSHDYTFFSMMSAAILFAYLIDELLTFLDSHKFYLQQYPSIVYIKKFSDKALSFSIAVIVMSCLVFKIPAAVVTGCQNLYTYADKTEKQIKRNEFIAKIKNINPRNLLVLSHASQAHWMSLLEIGSPVPIPSFVEMLTVSDYETVLSYIVSGDIEHLLIDEQDWNEFSDIVSKNINHQVITDDPDIGFVLIKITGFKSEQELNQKNMLSK